MNIIAKILGKSTPEQRSKIEKAMNGSKAAHEKLRAALEEKKAERVGTMINDLLGGNPNADN